MPLCRGGSLVGLLRESFIARRGAWVSDSQFFLPAHMYINRVAIIRALVLLTVWDSTLARRPRDVHKGFSQPNAAICSIYFTLALGWTMEVIVSVRRVQRRQGLHVGLHDPGL